MNLTNFLKQIDRLTQKYSNEQLTSFIHEIGRILPEKEREDFLKRLKEAGGVRKAEQEGNTASCVLSADEIYEAVKKDFDRIESSEVSIAGDLNEEYDDWYDDGEELIYEDPDDIAGMLKRACDLIHTYMDTECYKRGWEIGERLFALEIRCYSDYGDEDFTVNDMVACDFLHCDLKAVAMDTLYCAYHAVPLGERPEVLYGVITQAKEKDLCLEALLQHGDKELPEFQEFLKSWIAFLGNQTGENADRLFLEAVGLCNDTQTACQYAKQFATVHLALYLALLEQKEDFFPDDMVMLGEDALTQVPRQYTIRGKIALKTAEYKIAKKEDLESLKKCYLAAYESDTNAVNYLRALLNGFEHEQERHKLHKILETFPVSKNSSWESWRNGFNSERTENKPSKNMLLYLKILDGQFDAVFTKEFNQRKALGWSDTFLKQGIAVFLLAMHEGDWIGKGIMEMADRVKGDFGFSEETYRYGLAKVPEQNGKELFYEVIARWKELTPMEQKTKERVLKKIEALLEQRTAGIMEANRRNYYGECAAFIAALGEVKESIGETGAKQRLMTSYKEKYSRRTAFRGEMKNYGWRG